MDDYNAQVDRAAKSLRELAGADTARRVFGASTHRYLLLPPISEEEVLAFETQRGVRLPVDYRRFITTVGAGGAGPYYGLMDLAQASSATSPASPFPWTGEAASNADVFAAGWPDANPGVLQLAHEGCGYFDLLVVNGESAGTMWVDVVAADLGFRRIARSFVKWFGDWADGALRRLALQPTVDRLKVGMTRQDVIDILGEPEAVAAANPRSRQPASMSYGDHRVTLFLSEAGAVAKIVRHSL